MTEDNETRLVMTITVLIAGLFMGYLITSLHYKHKYNETISIDRSLEEEVLYP